MIRGLAIGGAFALATALLIAPVATASAGTAATAPGVVVPVDRTIPLPIGEVTGLLVDQADGLVFYSSLNSFQAGGPAGGVAVSKLDGSDLSAVPGVSATSQIVFGPDGKIYAAEADDTIAAIDPTTLAVTNFPTGSATYPYSLAFGGSSSLWFTYSSSTSKLAGLAHLDLTSGTVTVVSSHERSYFERVFSIPGQSDTILGYNFAGDFKVDLISVHDATFTIAKQTSALGLAGVSVSPDGSTVFAAGAGLGGVAQFRAADLTRLPLTYPAAKPTGGVPTADGSLFAMWGADGGRYAKIATYRGGSTQTIHVYDTADGGRAAQPGLSTMPRRVAWSGTTLLAVYTDTDFGSPVLKVLNTALQAPTSLTFTGPKSVGRAQRLALTGQVVGASSSERVTITKRDLAGVHTIGDVLTDATGRFAINDIPAVGGPNTYVARYYGNQSHSAIAKPLVVSVSRGTVPITLGLNEPSYNYSQFARLSIHVSSHDGHQVEVLTSPAGTAPRHLATVNLDNNGNGHVDTRLSYNTRFYVQFPGDYYYNPRTAIIAVGTRVALTVAPSGQSGTTGGYFLFHAGQPAKFGARISPIKHGCASADIQIYSNGRWKQLNGGHCAFFFYGSTTGYRLADIGLPNPYRIRAVYSSEHANLGATTGWVYFQFR